MKMHYRREIDGLRAIAVLPVILFHAGIQMFSGGFIGVDIFFVISGYLITTIILTEKIEGRFSLIRFYERRARRILPALFFVLLVCLPLAWWILIPHDMRAFSKSLGYIPVFASNMFFARTSGYFDGAAELKPLLHTWSLAVEEQYYLLFPLLLLLTWRWGQRWIILLLTLLGMASLVGAQWGLVYHPTATFYVLPARAWELLAGSFTAFYLLTHPKPLIHPFIKETFALVGLILIGLSVFGLNKNTPFPGLYALLPVMGAVLIILFATPHTFAGRWLGNKFFVGIGLISYSAYLWHYPLFAFARLSTENSPTLWAMGGLVALCLGLAYLSWRFIETPFRDKKRFTRRQIFIWSALDSVVTR